MREGDKIKKVCKKKIIYFHQIYMKKKIIYICFQKFN